MNCIIPACRRTSATIKVLIGGRHAGYACDPHAADLWGSAGPPQDVAATANASERAGSADNEEEE